MPVGAGAACGCGCGTRALPTGIGGCCGAAVEATEFSCSAAVAAGVCGCGAAVAMTGFGRASWSAGLLSGCCPGGQPLPTFLQQYLFFTGLQEACQLLKATLQSIGGQGEVLKTLLIEGGWKGCPGHALFSCVQHHAFFVADQAICQLSTSTAQSKRNVVKGTAFPPGACAKLSRKSPSTLPSGRRYPPTTGAIVANYRWWLHCQCWWQLPEQVKQQPQTPADLRCAAKHWMPVTTAAA
mmetsp:Transcript_89601/g.172473  ORF Transcript_89601/g.172473 Transcript_89601/m.172473 type:complete len:239 (-) Transcript_89601:7-723(-)